MSIDPGQTENQNEFQDGQFDVSKFPPEICRVGKIRFSNKEIMRKSSSQVMSLIVLLVFRLGSSGDMIIWGSGPE